jgi:hypothetical protein
MLELPLEEEAPPLAEELPPEAPPAACGKAGEALTKSKVMQITTSGVVRRVIQFVS